MLVLRRSDAAPPVERVPGRDRDGDPQRAACPDSTFFGQHDPLSQLCSFDRTARLPVISLPVDVIEARQLHPLRRGGVKKVAVAHVDADMVVGSRRLEEDQIPCLEILFRDPVTFQNLFFGRPRQLESEGFTEYVLHQRRAVDATVRRSAEHVRRSDPPLMFIQQGLAYQRRGDALRPEVPDLLGCRWDALGNVDRNSASLDQGK